MSTGFPKRNRTAGLEEWCAIQCILRRNVGLSCQKKIRSLNRCIHDAACAARLAKNAVQKRDHLVSKATSGAVKVGMLTTHRLGRTTRTI